MIDQQKIKRIAKWAGWKIGKGRTINWWYDGVLMASADHITADGEKIIKAKIFVKEYRIVFTGTKDKKHVAIWTEEQWLGQGGLGLGTPEGSGVAEDEATALVEAVCQMLEED